MTWNFETIKERTVVEPSTNTADTIEGNFEQAAGIHGKGLRLDGFTIRVVRDGKKTVKPGDEFSIQAWIALGEYPENWCPVITTESSEEVKGYRLLIGPYGQVSFETAVSEQWIACTSADRVIPLRQWMHLAGVYTAGKAMTLYVNGKALCTVPIEGSLTYPSKNNCILGMVASPRRPSDTIRTWGTVPTYYGLNGIIDEIMVFDNALNPDQVKRRFSMYKVVAPDIQPRRLPTIKKNPGCFGAFYTKLKYYEGWDNLWRVDQHPDIVVCFDSSPVKLIFWRGIRYGAAWVSENENWMTDQSLETWGTGKNDIEGCFEHMQDRHCRFSHVRIIETSDARSVVHWRYALVSSHDHLWMPDPKTDWGCWVDEYYTIYPDGSAVRKVAWQKGSTGRAIQYQESIPLTQPGQRLEELLEDDYVRVADYKYNTLAVSVDPEKKPADWNRRYTIQQYQFKSQNKPYICFEPGNRMWVRWIKGSYNHFPVNQARCDGRWARTLDRPASTMSSPCSDPVIHQHGNRLFWRALYGMNTMSIEDLIRFGRSWAYAPELTTGGAFVSKGYDRSERCYQIENRSGTARTATIHLAGSGESPVWNPAFCIKNWNADGARILVNGTPHTKCRKGIRRTLEGTDLILFVPLKETALVDITVSPAGTPKYTYLAPTPPMGWNSWNFYAKEINEAVIKATADAMVDSGMRDAGYEYLVLDDAWMAPERDENGALQADPEKFPKGMKDIGDYLHSKGLKFGIYEDRAYRTCQSLPGSFEHEEIDMATFAKWGVDYIKLDSCSAEHNGRLSSEDYAIYRNCIEATGRPMVLSISDFGNAAWVWGGKETSQLWRTGWDIRARMSSVYNCADCSAGSHRSHPAFNGLWQFAGPGHWNDPDMLQVGNIEIEDDAVRLAADKAHFGLWCILAAPLMAGNDLTQMTDTVREVLTTPEVIAVNQDPRGVQGYKVFVDDSLEVYNKPLSDGTTAVLLLNKGREKADITVAWEMIGLSGMQPVRDLWARKDLGTFQNAFTAKGLGQHGSMLLKIGKKGAPLPAPEPMPLEKYTITRTGVTSLSDLYYAWRDFSVPVYNKTYEGNPIVINGKIFEKGFGVKSRAAFMFAGTERGDRMMGTVALDASYKGNNQGRFRIFHEDYFGNRVLWDSGQMTKGSPAKTFDIELDNYNCLMLTFDGKNSETKKRANDVLGVFGDPRVIADRKKQME